LPTHPHCPRGATDDTVEQIFARLEDMSAVGGGDDGAAAFASEALSTLRRMSPTSMKLTLRLLRAARGAADAVAPLTDCLQREFRVVQRCVTPAKPIGSDDFFEGIRAALIDKDRAPKWSPPSLEQVCDDDPRCHCCALAV
jgi:enoyl-CoA hydratase